MYGILYWLVVRGRFAPRTFALEGWMNGISAADPRAAHDSNPPDERGLPPSEISINGPRYRQYQLDLVKAANQRIR